MTTPRSRTGGHASPPMSTGQVAAESGRHPQSVLAALRHRRLHGTQPRANGLWRINRPDFEEWMAQGAPIDDPAKARLRRSA